MSDMPTFDIEEVFADRLDAMFTAQRDLQAQSFNHSMEDLVTGHPVLRINYFKENVLALTDELHEAMGEIGWKSWAKSNHFNEDKVKGELVDAFHFFMNLCLAAGMTPDELFKRYRAKRAINVQRQADGYDGVSTKCPRCKRALDDIAVTCGKEWCQMYGPLDA